ncbi:hypothetical protein [Streptomyces mirabilis]|uniref:hypothetical protein n=1 Tax=Streptomyces mirabilis TaxID=68239 RepID=UPI00364F44DD
MALGDSERSGAGRAVGREGGSGLARAVIDPAAGTMRRSGAFDALRWYDTQGAAGSWHAGNHSVGEPVFAPVPGDPSEDHDY